MSKQIVKDEKTGIRYEVVDLIHVFDKEDDLSFHDNSIGVAEWSVEGYFSAERYDSDEEYMQLFSDDFSQDEEEEWLGKKQDYFNDLMNKGKYQKVIEESGCRYCEWEVVGQQLELIGE